MKKFAVAMFLLLCGAVPLQAQSQYETAFEFGVGYARSATDFDMVSVLLQSDDYFFEGGLSFNVNGGLNEDTLFSWLLRAAVRPVLLGNTVVHLGGEFSLHTNATFDGPDAATLVGLGFLFGVMHPLNDHLNFGLHVYPLSFGFGGNNTVVTLGTASLGAHVLF